MKLHKKGIEMQVFSFIFALILIALILGYGVKSLMRLKGISEDVDLGDFVFRMKDEVNTMYTFDAGSSKEVTLFLPEKAERVCFYDSDKEVDLAGIDNTLKNYLETNPGKNVFVMPFVFAQDVFYIDHLRAGGDDNPLCFLTKGKIEMMLKTALGDDGKIYVEANRLS